MQWHDPLRPTLGNGRPCLLDASGRGLTALPYITLCPRPTGRIELLASLPRRPNEFQYYSVETTPESLPIVLAEVMANPEEAFAKWGWTYAAEARPPAKAPVLTLEDLGL